MKRPLHHLRYILHALVFGISCVGILSGQENEKQSALYSFFDKTIGTTNSGVFNGIAYVEQFRVLGNKHKFFLKLGFMVGSVAYDGQQYFGYEMKYDVYGDELLLRLPGVNGFPAVQLIKERVVNFEIEGHRFENITPNDHKESAVSGFVEILLSGENFTFFKKHKKNILKKSDKKVLYHEFKDLSDYFIRLDGEFHKVKSLKNISGLFPNYRKQLSDFAASYKDIRKSDSELYLMSVLSDLDELIYFEKGEEP